MKLNIAKGLILGSWVIIVGLIIIGSLSLINYGEDEKQEFCESQGLEYEEYNIYCYEIIDNTIIRYEIKDHNDEYYFVVKE